MAAATMTWWQDPMSDDTVIDVGGFARLRLDPWQFSREARKTFPILSAMSGLAEQHFESLWLRRNIAPLIHLSMPGHE